MIDLLIDNLEFEKNNNVFDCYCGVGFFSAFIAEKVNKIIGIESSEDACSDFAVNLDQYDHIDLYQGYVEHVLPELDIHPDVVIMDPPRAGIAPAAIKALVKSNPKKIAYISCDPSTLARDLKILVSANYVIQKIIPMDMFPQTYHIETMAFLTKSE
jgi:23S rRNA (uracil1939-C5)-methyltransferase